MTTINFTLNGAPQEISVREGESLLEALRDRCGVRSTKDGCAPQGQCGCCLALMNGKPRVTCATAAIKAEGKEIVTLEGVTDDERAELAAAFVNAGATQCGFCTPGIMLRAKAIIEKNAEPTRAEIAKALDVHLCRCTGYTKVIDAVELLAEAKRNDEPLAPPIEDGRVGSRLARFEGHAQSLGDRPYVDDLEFDGMLRGVVIQSPYARAKVLSIDTSAAEAMAGVEIVVTAKDVPGDPWYGLIYADWSAFIGVGQESRSVGDVIAAVAATDIHTAREAAAAIKVEYEVLEPTCDPRESVKDGARQINPQKPNILSKTVIKLGEPVEDVLAKSAHVATGVWKTQRIEHLFLEPESAVAKPREGGGIHLYSQGQGVFDDRRQLATFLGMPADDIFVELVPNGGGFGGKEDMSIQPHAALICTLTGKPVKVTLTREQSVRMHPKRHPFIMEYSLGCDAEGHLTAAHVRILGDTGAYASVGGKVLERGAGHACGPYIVPHVDIEAVAAYTNNPPCGAMRGFGVNQTNFAIEGCMDILGEKLGMDPWELRYKNAVEVGSQLGTGQILEKSVGLKKTLDAVKPAYDEAIAAGRAVGVSCGMKNSGLGNGAKEWGKARLVVEDDLSISVYNGFTEMGQGLFTILTQCAVEVTGLEASRFKPKVDSNFVLEVGQTTGSRATLLGGRAVKEASLKLKADLDGGKSLGDLVGSVYAGDVLIDDTTVPGAKVDKIKLHTSYGFATQMVILDENGRVDKVVAAHDVGRAINPQLCEGQIEGSVHMGLGFALSEDLPCEDGMPVTSKLREIGVLRARDMPDVEVILIEEHEPEGPFGAKGLGEIGLVPTAGAVASALRVFDGVRRHQLPMKDSPAGKAISVGKIKKKKKKAPRASV